MTAKWLIIAGIALVVVGLLLHFIPGLFSWFGRLPGDIRVEHEHAHIYIPITSMVIVSIMLSLLLYLFRH
jgi:H+/Cl- antiporter ClcA